MKHIEHKLLLALCNAADESGGHIKIENEAYMPLTVENIGHQNLANVELAAYSLCHYGEQNGDLMRDPEMVFVKRPLGLKVNGIERVWFYATYYRNDYVSCEQDALINDGKQYRKGMQANQSTFARQWLSNLRQQGFETRLEQMQKVA